MPTMKTRLSKLEYVVPLRCHRCGHHLRCDLCEYGVDVRTAPTAELEKIVLHGVRKLLDRHGISFFRVIGCDLNTLSVEDLRTLKALLLKMNEAGEPLPADVEP